MVHSVNYRRLVPGVSVIKGFKVCMNLPSRAEILCSLFVLERVRIIEVFLEEMYENFVGTEETVRIEKVSVLGRCPYWRGVRILGEVSVWRGSTVQEMM